VRASLFSGSRSAMIEAIALALVNPAVT